MTLALNRPPGARREPARCAPHVEELVHTHLPLVRHLVREIVNRVPSHVDRDELTSAAMYALAASARTFDPSVGTSFGTFATIRIRGALADELRSMDWASRSVRSKAREIEATRNELTQLLGRAPSSAELAEAMGVTDGQLSATEADVHRAAVLSLHALSPEAAADAVPEHADGPETLLLRREELGCLQEAIAELPERLRTVVEQYFFHQRRMVDIAAELGVTESRISQMRSEALAALRRTLGSLGVLPGEAVSGTRAAARNSHPVTGGPTVAARGSGSTTLGRRSTIADRLAATTVLGERRPDFVRPLPPIADAG